MTSAKFKNTDIDVNLCFQHWCRHQAHCNQSQRSSMQWQINTVTIEEKILCLVVSLVPFMITGLLDFVNHDIVNRIQCYINWICFHIMVKEWDCTCSVGSARRGQSQSLDKCYVWNSRQYMKSKNLLIVNVMYRYCNRL